MYGSYNKKRLKAVIDDVATLKGYKSIIRTRVRLQPPPRHVFPIGK